MTPILQIAQRYRDVGISVLPIRTDKTKAPTLPTWKHLQEKAAEPEELPDLFAGNCGIAAIGGKVSGNLEVIDFDEAGYFENWSAVVESHLGREFVDRLLVVRTPRPGYHVHLRCTTINGNQKLAMKYTDDGKTKTTIETKAEGGYVLLPGCPPACHETGRTYEIIRGTFRAIPSVTEQEREILLACARSLNEVVREEPQFSSHPRPHTGQRPGDEFIAETSWEEILRPAGYRYCGRNGECVLWTRPGKEHGPSVTTNYKGSDLLYVFSSNCHPFEDQRTYNKFAAYTWLSHNGDFTASTRALREQGYGPAMPHSVPRQQEPSQPEPPPQPKVEPIPSDIVEPISLLGQMRELYRTGLPPGESPGWDSVRQLWTLRKGELTLVTGIPSHGKTAFINAVMVNLARRNGWKWGVYSAENIPHTVHMADLLEQYCGRPFNEGYHQRIQPEEHDAGMKFLQDHFRFIAPPDDEQTVDRIVNCAKELVKSLHIDAVVLDPWNEMTHNWSELRIPETEYISRALKRMKRFAQKSNVHVILVAHPKQLNKEKDGKYPIPTPYDISGSANWRNKADCALCVWRDEAKPGETVIYVQKIRRRFVGRIGKVELKYDLVNGRFSEYQAYGRSRQPGDDDE